MVTTQSHTPSPHGHADPLPLRRWSGRIGALALAGLSIAHLVINSIGFARDPGSGWLLFVVFGVGVSLVAAALAVVTWQDAGRVRRATWARILIAVAGVFCFVTIVTMVRGGHAALLPSPIGPGLWCVVGGPALLLTAVLPRRRTARSTDPEFC